MAAGSPTSQLLESMKAEVVNDVSFGSVGRFCFTPASQVFRFPEAFEVAGQEMQHSAYRPAQGKDRLTAE
jgi:hypothetical protein